MVKNYIDLVFKKEKKPISLEKVYSKVERLLQKENDEYVLTFKDKKDINSILADGIKKYDYYKTPSGKYTSLLKTSFRKGRFHGNRAGEGFVSTIISYFDRDGNQIVKEEKFSVEKDSCNGAIDGDFVLVDIGGNGVKPRIEKVIDRNLENITGEVIRMGNSYFVKPIDKKKQFLTIALEGEAIEGQRVSVLFSPVTG